MQGPGTDRRRQPCGGTAPQTQRGRMTTMLMAQDTLTPADGCGGGCGHCCLTIEGKEAGAPDYTARQCRRPRVAGKLVTMTLPRGAVARGQLALESRADGSAALWEVSEDQHVCVAARQQDCISFKVDML